MSVVRIAPNALPEIGSNITSDSFSYDIGSDLNRSIAICFSFDAEADQTVVSVTYGGVALTTNVTNIGGAGVSIYYDKTNLMNSNTVVVTYSNQVVGNVINCVGASNANQTTVVEAGHTAFNDGDDTGPNVTVTSVSGELVVATGRADSSGVTVSQNVGTLEWAANSGNASDPNDSPFVEPVGWGITKIASGVSEVSSVTLGSSKFWGMVAIAFKEAPIPVPGGGLPHQKIGFGLGVGL